MDTGQSWIAETRFVEISFVTVSKPEMASGHSSGVRRNFWPLRNCWPVIVFQLFCFSE